MWCWPKPILQEENLEKQTALWFNRHEGTQKLLLLYLAVCLTPSLFLIFLHVYSLFFTIKINKYIYYKIKTWTHEVEVVWNVRSCQCLEMIKWTERHTDTYNMSFGLVRESLFTYFTTFHQTRAIFRLKVKSHQSKHSTQVLFLTHLFSFFFFI